MLYDKIIFCPKCNGEDVEITIIEPPKTKRVSIDDVPAESLNVQGFELIHHDTTYKATCKNCGYTKTWSV